MRGSTYVCIRAGLDVACTSALYGCTHAPAFRGPVRIVCIHAGLDLVVVVLVSLSFVIFASGAGSRISQRYFQPDKTNRTINRLACSALLCSALPCPAPTVRMVSMLRLRAAARYREEEHVLALALAGPKNASICTAASQTAAPCPALPVPA